MRAGRVVRGVGRVDEVGGGGGLDTLTLARQIYTLHGNKLDILFKPEMLNFGRLSRS